MRRIVPTRVDFFHQFDTPEDAAGHIKSVLTGCNMTLIIHEGKLLLANQNGPDYSRAQETIGAISQMRGRLLVVTDSEAFPLPENAERILVPAAAYDWLSPLLNDLPISLFAGYLCELKHEAYGRGGREDWKTLSGTSLLTGSQFVLL